MSWLDSLKQEQQTVKCQSDEAAAQHARTERELRRQFDALCAQYDGLIRRRLREFGKVRFADHLSRDRWRHPFRRIWVGCEKKNNKSHLSAIWGCDTSDTMEKLVQRSFEEGGNYRKDIHYAAYQVKLERTYGHDDSGLRFVVVPGFSSIDANEFTDEWLRQSLLAVVKG